MFQIHQVDEQHLVAITQAQIYLLEVRMIQVKLSISVQYFPLVSVQLFPFYRFAERDFGDA